MAQTTHAVDLHVGRRLRERRITLGWSQSKLGNSVGLTFQQMQKYERGANRISASKLYELAQALGVEVAYFFEGLSGEPVGRDTPRTGSVDASEAEVASGGRDRQSLLLNQAFQRISSQEVRQRIVSLVRVIAG